MEYVDLSQRVYADLDNERVEPDVVGLTKTDFVKSVGGDLVKICEGEYLHLFMDIIDDDGSNSYVVSEGIVISNPYAFKPYKWCCRLTENIEYIDDYLRRFKGA
jgi:hypothetical protein